MIKKILCFCTLFLLLPLNINAADTEVVGLESIVNVSKNRIAKIEENINIYIINETNEFERNLDKDLYIYRKDNSKILYDIKIDKIVSKDLNKIESTSKKEKVIFNINEKKDKIQNISLNYNYNLGKDKSNKYDEFYYNIVSNFDSIASNISFEITLPEDTKINKIDFAINGEYKVSKDDVTYVVENNVITGYLNIMLEENDVFSIRVELPDGYFVGGTDNFNYLSYLYLIFPIITIILTIFYWVKYAKGNRSIKKYVYYPPNDFDSVEIGYLYKGLTEETDLVSILIFLANQGYLKIEENEDGYKLGTENSFKFIKIKDYEKNNAVQKLLFDGLFKNNDVVELKEIEYNYNSKIIDIKKMIDNKNNRLKLFNMSINKAKLHSMIMIIISIIVLNVMPIYELTGTYLLVPIAAFIMMFGLAILFIFNLKGILKLLLGILFVAGVAFISINTLSGQLHPLIIYSVSLVFTLLSSILYSKLPIRTKYGNQKLGETEGFKLALLNMNKNQLQEIMKEQPNYFYDMVPYASVFGILNEWMSKGKGLITNRPEWHITNEQFDLNKECRFFKNVIYTTSKVMIKAIYAKKESSQIEFKRDEINAKLNNQE